MRIQENIKLTILLFKGMEINILTHWICNNVNKWRVIKSLIIKRLILMMILTAKIPTEKIMTKMNILKKMIIIILKKINGMAKKIIQTMTMMRTEKMMTTKITR